MTAERLRGNDLLDSFRPAAVKASPAGEVWLHHPDAMHLLDACMAEGVAVAAFELACEDDDGAFTLFLPTQGSALVADEVQITAEVVRATVERAREILGDGLPRADWWWPDRPEPTDWHETAPRATLVSFFLRDQETTSI